LQFAMPVRLQLQLESQLRLLDLAK
jgi:hypothetical protein